MNEHLVTFRTTYSCKCICFQPKECTHFDKQQPVLILHNNMECILLEKTHLHRNELTELSNIVVNIVWYWNLHYRLIFNLKSNWFSTEMLYRFFYVEINIIFIQRSEERVFSFFNQNKNRSSLFQF